MTVAHPKAQPKAQPIKVWALGKQYISVEAPVDSCEGCAAEDNEKLCEALPSCYNCIWEEV